MDNATQTEMDRLTRNFGYRAAVEMYPYTLCYRYPAQLEDHPDHVMYYRREEDRRSHADSIRGIGGRITGASGGDTNLYKERPITKFADTDRYPGWDRDKFPEPDLTPGIAEKYRDEIEWATRADATTIRTELVDYLIAHPDHDARYWTLHILCQRANREGGEIAQALNDTQHDMGRVGREG